MGHYFCSVYFNFTYHDHTPADCSLEHFADKHYKKPVLCNTPRRERDTHTRQQAKQQVQSSINYKSKAKHYIPSTPTEAEGRKPRLPTNLTILREGQTTQHEHILHSILFSWQSSDQKAQDLTLSRINPDPDPQFQSKARLGLITN
jgi:hypothetical protein